MDKTHRPLRDCAIRLLRRAGPTTWILWTLSALAVVAAPTLDLLPGAQPGWGVAQRGTLVAGLALGASTLLPSPWHPRILALTLSSVLALLAAEIVLRVTVGPRFAAVFQPHPRYLHAFVPDSVHAFQHTRGDGGNRVAVRINAHGFRGPPPQEPRSAPRVVVYGDSLVAARYVPEAETFVTRLGEALGRSLGRDVEALNVGVSGYGPDQVALRMEDELPVLDPDLAIVGLYAGNDFGDLIRNRLFRLGEDGRLRALRPRLAPAQQREFDQARRAPILQKLTLRILRARRLARERRQLGDDHGNHLLRTWLRGRQREWAAYRGPGPDVVAHLFKDSYDADLSIAPESAASVYKRRLMEAVLAKIVAVAAANAVPLLGVAIPSPIDVCANHHIAEIDTVSFPRYRREALTEALTEASRASDLEVVNLFPVLREAGGCSLYYRDNTHWNAAGQKLAAQAVAGTVLERGLLRRAARDAFRPSGRSRR
ncbi:GDSL-type esterase/lipase family protein [bacterium]|nr:GDSL-type esterase/lipase family protein [bacterium]